MLPIGPAGGPQSGFSTPRYVLCTKGLSQKTTGSAPPRPPPVVPRSWVPWCLVNLVWSAEGLPSTTRNWHWQLALPVAPVTHHPPARPSR
jgi:hypothetical protein